MNVDFKITYEFDGEVYNTEQYDNIEDMIENGLTGLDFSDLVSVPDDVSVTGIGNNSISYIISPSLTTAEMFPQHSGSQAAIMLFRSIESGAKPEGTHYVDFKILERESI